MKGLASSPEVYSLHFLDDQLFRPMKALAFST